VYKHFQTFWQCIKRSKRQETLLWMGKLSTESIKYGSQVTPEPRLNLDKDLWIENKLSV